MYSVKRLDCSINLHVMCSSVNITVYTYTSGLSTGTSFIPSFLHSLHDPWSIRFFGAMNTAGRIAILTVVILALFWFGVYISLTASATNAGPSVQLRKLPQFSPLQSQKMNRERYAVIIRSHERYVKHLMSLLWALDAQTVADGLYVIVAPTEYDSIEPIEKMLQQSWTDLPHVSVRVLKIDKHQYDDNCCVLEKICTPLWRRGKLFRNWSTEALDTYCTVNSPLHYFVTDRALDQVRRECMFCEFLLVTNADNYYSPDFLLKTSHLLTTSRTDLVMTDMLHRGQKIETKVESGYMDLGCVLSRFGIFLGAKNLDFTSLLPENAEPQDWHDADFWLVYHLMNKHGKRLSYIRETMFVHN